MDTDSSLLPSALVFSAFFLLFIYLSLAEHAALAGNGSLSPRPSRSFGFAVSSFKYACVIAVSVSGLALIMNIQPLAWPVIAILALTLLVVLTVVNRLLFKFAARYPARAKAWSGPLQSLVSAPGERRPATGSAPASTNGAATESVNEVHLALEEQIMAAAAELGSSIDERDREMLRSILHLDVSTAREIMVPRLDMVAIDVTASLSDAAVYMGANGHSRLPVYEENLDSIVGIVHSMDLLTILGSGQPDKPLRETTRPAFFIPESKRLDDLLAEFQDKGLQMAIVVDEYGGTEGLVTMEDLLEEIVGEIEDEFSRDQDPEVVKFPDGSALVDAGVTTEEVKELFGIAIDSTDVDTVGGFVYRTLGRIPQTGDMVEVGTLRIEVVSILGRRLRKLRIHCEAEEATTQQQAAAS